jgi:hypothetical protein
MNHDKSRQSVQDAASGSRGRAAYKTPELAEYGQLRSMTAAGAGSLQENAMPMTNLMKFP